VIYVVPAVAAILLASGLAPAYVIDSAAAPTSGIQKNQNFLEVILPGSSSNR